MSTSVPATLTVGSRLKDKVAIVSGGAMGFGEAITRRFVEEGAKVVILDLNTTEGNRVQKDLSPSVAFVEANVMTREGWEKGLEAAIKNFGYLNVLINNAGVTRNAAAHELPEKDFDLMAGIHLKGLYYSTQVLFPHFLERGDGAVVNIASTGATRPRPGFTWYNTTKGGVIAGTKSLAIEYAPKIRVNCVVPAIGNTNMLLTSFGGRKPDESEMSWVYDMIPMKRITEPVDIANAALYLVSNEASFVTGAVLEVDGGRGI